MTVIAWDGKTLAADKEMMSGYLRSPRVTKIKRSVTGSLMGGTGNASMVCELFAWWERGAKPEEWPAGNRDAKDCSHLIIILGGNKKIWCYQCGPYPIEIEAEKMAWGCGSEVAMAVLYLGHDSVKAVEMANMIISGCGNGVDTLVIEDE